MQLGEQTYENNHYLNLPLSLFSVLQNAILVTEQGKKKSSPKACVIVLIFLLVKCFFGDCDIYVCFNVIYRALRAAAYSCN